MTPKSTNDNATSTRGSSLKVNNDPWAPLESSANQTQSHSQSDSETEAVTDTGSTASVNSIQPAPQNPLYQMIDSEKYINLLEQKLAKLSKNKQSKQKEPTSRDILNSLAVFHEDQMRRYLDDDSTTHSPRTMSNPQDEGFAQSSYLHRRLHPDRQPLSAEEIAELVKEDALAERFMELFVESDIAAAVASASSTSKGAGSSRTSAATPTTANTNSLNNSTKTQSQANAGSVSDQPVENSGEENWANFNEFVDRETERNINEQK